MFQRAIFLLCATCVSACASLSGHQVRHEGAAYQQLIGEQLRSAIQGKHLTFPDDERSEVITSSVRCHSFHVLGYYLRCRHRANMSGTYTVSDDRVCATTGIKPELTCWALYSDSEGRYLLKTLSPTPAPPERVSLEARPELNRR